MCELKQNKMKLICINEMNAWWGEILKPGDEYEGVIKYGKTEIITDYKAYNHYLSLVSQSYNWIKKGYNESNLHEVISGYITRSEKLYTKDIDIPYISVICSDNNTYQFCLLSDSELFELGADKDYYGKPTFSLTVNMVDDYFDYASVRRENKLNKILGSDI